MKTILFSLFITVVGLASFSYAITIDTFDYPTNAALTTAYAITNSDGALSSSISISTTEKHSGTAAMQWVFNYASGKQYQYSSLTKTLSAPLDLTNAKKFSIWVKGDPTNIPSPGTHRVIWIVWLYSANGATYRYVNWDGVDISHSDWTKITWNLTNMEEYQYAFYIDKPQLNDITQISLTMMVDETNAGSITAYFDDWEYYNGDSNIGTQTLEDFNYPTNAALTTAWLTASWSAKDTVSRQLSTTYKVEGSGAINLTYNMYDAWWYMFCWKTLPTPVDMSNISYFTLWEKGDGNLAASTAAHWLNFYLEDTAGNRVASQFNSAAITTTWNCYWFQFLTGSYDTYYNPSGPFLQDPYDADESLNNFDATQVSRIGILYQLNNSDGSDLRYDLNIFVDDIVAGFSTSNPMLTTPSIIGAHPGGAGIPITLTGGAAPFAWTITPGIGTLSLTTGTNVTYTPAAVQTTGNITITDAGDDQLIIPVTVKPTSAPLAPDMAIAPAIRERIKLNWALFE
jgi:hypothetical protein